MRFYTKARFWVGYLVAERWKAKFRGCLLQHQRVETLKSPCPLKHRSIALSVTQSHLLSNALCHPTKRYEQSSTTYECQTVLRIWFSSFLIDPDPPARFSTFEFGTLDIMLTLLVSAAGIRVTCLLNLINHDKSMSFVLPVNKSFANDIIIKNLQCLTSAKMDAF